MQNIKPHEGSFADIMEVVQSYWKAGIRVGIQRKSGTWRVLVR